MRFDYDSRSDTLPQTYHTLDAFRNAFGAAAGASANRTRSRPEYQTGGPHHRSVPALISSLRIRVLLAPRGVCVKDFMRPCRRRVSGLRTLGADEFADSGQQYGGFAYNDALTVLHAQHTPIFYPSAGMVWHINDGVSLTFLGPETPFITGSRNDINNNSLVFMLQYKSFRMLFPAMLEPRPSGASYPKASTCMRGC